MPRALLFFLTVSLFLIGSALGQDEKPSLPPLPEVPRPPMGAMPPPGGSAKLETVRLRLLEREDVRKLLEVLADQQEQIEKIKQEHLDELNKIISEKGEELDDKLRKVLVPQQAERLREIVIEVGGVRALTDGEVAQLLGLSEKQKEQLAKINKEQMVRGRELFDGLRTGKAKIDEMPAKMQELTANFEKESLDVLSAQQQKKLEGLKGKPSDIGIKPPGAPRGLPKLPR